MVPIISQTTVGGKPLSSVMKADKIDEIVKRTCNRGAEIVSFLGSGSAYYSPSASVFKMIDCIMNNKLEVMALSVCLEGEYGHKDMAIGVPCRLGRNGIDEIITLKLAKDEEEAFNRSAAAMRESIKIAS